VPTLPVGWTTDVAVLEHGGSTVDDRGDHLVVRSPHNPYFHWGNFVLVTDVAAVDDARRWARVFSDAFPRADYVAIGLPVAPDPGPWQAAGITLGTNDVLSTTSLPMLRPLPEGYAVRPLAGDDDWEHVVVADLGENAESAHEDPVGFERFARARVATRRALAGRGVARYLGVFAAGTLAAELGIVVCGETARYQDVRTAPGHRRRGLAGHLLGAAARWAADAGCSRWVIVADAGGPAGRLYRSIGFVEDARTIEAYRACSGHLERGDMRRSSHRNRDVTRG